MASPMMDRSYERILEDAGIDLGEELPEDFEGIAYQVTIEWEGAVEDDWLLEDRFLAESQAEEIAEHYAGDNMRAVVSEVYVGGDTIEGTGYMVDRVFDAPEEELLTGRIRVGAGDVRDFKRQWPASGLPDAAIIFEYSDGDLVGIESDGDLEPAEGSGAIAALSEDALEGLVGRLI